MRNMAYFDKLPTLDKTGWDKIKETQSLALGKSAYIGLFGKGPAGEDLVVSATDPSICVTHEEPVPKIAGWRVFLLTSLQDGDTIVTARTSTGIVAASLTVHVTGKSGLRMVFFPGERTMVNAKGTPVTVGTIYMIGAAGQTMKAAAGPPGMPAGGKPVEGQGGHTMESTPAGRYILGPQEHVTTRNWTHSVVPWGAPLRINSAGEVEFQGKSSHWTLATGPRGEVTWAVGLFVKRNKKSYPPSAIQAAARDIFISPDTGKLRWSTYLANDFGLWGWNLTKNGQRTGYFIHTTPNNENDSATATIHNLENSHGCVHLVPSERDRLMKAGFLKEGMPFEVRPYTETGPP